jgi:hypothetical protein
MTECVSGPLSNMVWFEAITLGEDPFQHLGRFMALSNDAKDRSRRRIRAFWNQRLDTEEWIPIHYWSSRYTIIRLS